MTITPRHLATLAACAAVAALLAACGRPAPESAGTDTDAAAADRTERAEPPPTSTSPRTGRPTAEEVVADLPDVPDDEDTTESAPDAAPAEPEEGAEPEEAEEPADEDADTTAPLAPAEPTPDPAAALAPELRAPITDVRREIRSLAVMPDEQMPLDRRLDAAQAQVEELCDQLASSPAISASQKALLDELRTGGGPVNWDDASNIVSDEDFARFAADIQRALDRLEEQLARR